MDVDRLSRILLCSPHCETAELVESSIGEMGFEMESYQTIDEVLTVLEKGHYDTFLMIVKGDEGDIKQIEKLSVVRKIDSDLPVVLISEGDSIDLEKSARLQGVFYYFVEPVNTKELKEVLRESAKIRLRRAERRIG